MELRHVVGEALDMTETWVLVQPQSCAMEDGMNQKYLEKTQKDLLLLRLNHTKLEKRFSWHLPVLGV